MLRKVAVFQKLFLNSTPSINFSQDSIKTGITLAAFVFTAFLMAQFFTGAPIPLAAGSIWLVNRILNGNQPLFKIVPVTRRFTVFNVYLASIVTAGILIIGLWFFSLALVALLFGIVYIVNPEGFGQAPPDFVPPETIVNTFQGNLFMFLLVIIILVVGTTIAFIRNSRHRNRSYAAFFVLGLGLLALLKSVMPVYPSTGKVEFMESLSIMPQVNEILIGVSTAAILIVSFSMYIGYRLYMTSANSESNALN